MKQSDTKDGEKLMGRIDLKGKTILITGVAGFIGAALAERMLRDESDVRIIGVDDMNDYYDPALKRARLRCVEEAAQETSAGERFVFLEKSISDREAMRELFEDERPELVVNLAAQAGVRYSVEAPYEFVDSNIIGFFNILECCRDFPVEHLIYASSSSVYGANEKVPYSTDDMTDSPVSLYAATKKCNEVLAYAYSELYDIPATGLRFFTVYGPWGRPDMAYYSFAEKLAGGEKIRLFNYGKCERDFTYIDDIVEGVMRIAVRVPEAKNPGSARANVYNIGNSEKTGLFDFARMLYEGLLRAGVLPEGFDLDGHIELAPMQQGDVPVTCADVSGLEQDCGFRPKIGLEDGLGKFCEWFAEYNGKAF